MSENTDNTAKKQQIGTPFKPGESGNPDGRPKGSKNYLTQLEEALLKYETATGKKLFDRLIQRAFINDNVLLNVMKKFVADKTHTEITGTEPLKFEVEVINGDKEAKGK